MTLGNIEIYDNYMLVSIPADELTDEMEARLTSDGWSLATNGHVENGVWYSIYTKNI